MNKEPKDRDDQIWESSTGKPLTLGQKVKICESSQFHHDYAWIDFYVTGMHFERNGKTINITIGEGVGELESDGWRIADLLPIA